MPKSSKTSKAAVKPIVAKSAAAKSPPIKPAKAQPSLRAIKGGVTTPPKSKPGAGPAKLVMKAVSAKPALAPADDAPVIALNLAPAKLSPAMAAYFKKCQDKLGFVPNVLVAYAFDMAKLKSFVAMYNDLMLGDSRPLQT